MGLDALSDKGGRLSGLAGQCQRHGLNALDVVRAVGDARLAGDKRSSKTAQGRYLITLEDGSQVAVGNLSTAEKKTAFCLRENVKALAHVYGLERLGFFTLTFADAVTDVKEAQRRFNSLATHYLRKKFPDWLMVVEPQGKRGNAVHYHLLVVCPADIRTGFDFEAITRRDYRSAGGQLRALWSELRTVLPRYGFGRSELLPIRSTQEGIAKYVGKYISKGCGDRLAGWEGARLVRYSTRTPWRTSFSNFAWNSAGAKSWRALVSDLAQEFGAADMDELRNRAGKRWAFWFKGYLAAVAEGCKPDVPSIADMMRLRRGCDLMLVMRRHGAGVAELLA